MAHKKPDNLLSVTFFGIAGSYPQAGQATSCIMIQSEQPYKGKEDTSRPFRMIMDVGSGALAKMTESGLRPQEDIDAIYITHAHPDHMMDLIFVGQDRFYTMNGHGIKDAHKNTILEQAAYEKMPLYGCQQVWDSLVSFCKTLPLTEKDLKNIFDFHNVENISGSGDEMKIGPFSIRTTMLNHIPEIADDYAIRLTEDNTGASLTYTGDGAFSRELVELAKGSDLLIASVPGIAPIHMFPADAVRTVKLAKIPRVILTHLVDHSHTLSWKQIAAIAKAKAEAVKGKMGAKVQITTAQPGLTVKVRRSHTEKNDGRIIHSFSRKLLVDPHESAISRISGKGRKNDRRPL